jgi:hypothetical protein
LLADVVVEFLDQGCAHHGEVGTEGRIGQADVESLVVDVGVEGIAGYQGTCHLGPRLYQPLLVKRSLQALFVEGLQDDVLDILYVALKHGGNLRFTIFDFRFTIYLAVLDVEDFVVEVAVLQYLVEVVAIGVGDEYLSETVAGH